MYIALIIAVLWEFSLEHLRGREGGARGACAGARRGGLQGGGGPFHSTAGPQGWSFVTYMHSMYMIYL